MTTQTPRSLLNGPAWQRRLPRYDNSSVAVSMAIAVTASMVVIFAVLMGIHLTWGLPAIFEASPRSGVAILLITLIAPIIGTILWLVVVYGYRVEVARGEREASMTLAAAAANIGLWSWDIAADKVWTTAHCRKMLGIDESASVSLGAFLERMHPEDSANLRETIDRTVATGGNFQVECRIRLPDNHVRWFAASGCVRHDRRLSLPGVTVVFVDITQRKDAEAEVARQQEHVTHLTRVDILNALSGAIAHQLNQPLSAILSNAQAVRRMLSRRTPDTVELGEALGDIIDDDNRAVEIIRQFRALLKKGEAKFESVDLNDILTRTLEFTRPDLRVRQVRTVKHLAPGPLMIRGDQIQLQQVILNLVINASESVIANEPDNRVLTVSTAIRNDAVELTVSDNGPGISPEAMPLLFESFRSTKKHGLGLGLSISRAIVSAHGGTIWAGNNAEGGANFYLKLPSLTTLNS